MNNNNKSLLYFFFFFLIVYPVYSQQFNIKDRYNNPTFSEIVIFDLNNNSLHEFSTQDYFSLNLPNQKINIELYFNKKSIQKIRFNNMVYSGKFELGVEEPSVDFLIINGKKPISAYAIDPTNIDFDYAEVTAVAKGTELYKCKEYNFTTGQCYGNFQKTMDLTPGTLYSFILTKEDPLYTEISYQTQGCSCTSSCTVPTAGSNPTCTAICTDYCEINFTVPQYAESGWLERVHYNVTITIAGTGTKESALQRGWLDRDLIEMSGDETVIGSSTTTTTLTTTFTNNNMPSSGSNAFNELNCTDTWGSRNCTWYPYINSSLTCSGKRQSCITTMVINFVNYTWNFTRYRPNITIISPENNTKVVDSLVYFYYNVTDPQTLQSCNLSINNITLNVTLTPQKSVILNFSRILTTRSNIWEINCSNNDTEQTHLGTSGLLNLTLNAIPWITNHVVLDPIDLIGGSNLSVTCNGTANDLDGFGDITKVNATLFFVDKTPASPDNLSNHYTNSSCNLLTGSGNSIDFTCGFEVIYYANNGTWYCNTTVVDSADTKNTSQISTTIRQLLAIGVYPELIDFGNMQALQISPNDMDINITNLGNVPLDLRLYAYALIENDNLSMVCERGIIPLENERFSIFPSQPFNSMTNVNNTLNSVFVDINIPRQVYGQEESKKPIFWKLQIPMATQGKCNGTVVFTAIPR